MANDTEDTNMKFLINLRHLERKDVTLEGEATAEELDLADYGDELLHLDAPARYRLTASLLQKSVLVDGTLEMTIRCECARCLKPFPYALTLDPWSALLELEGKEKVAIQDDCVDLTPFLREDIVLALPQHPLCKQECQGLPNATILIKPSEGSSQPDKVRGAASVWAALDQLKLK